MVNISLKLFSFQNATNATSASVILSLVVTDILSNPKQASLSYNDLQYS
jgi:hypothetical protein